MHRRLNSSITIEFPAILSCPAAWNLAPVSGLRHTSLKLPITTLLFALKPSWLPTMTYPVSVVPVALAPVAVLRPDAWTGRVVGAIVLTAWLLVVARHVLAP